MNREVYYLCSQSRCHVDVAFLHQGLHDMPQKLNMLLQKEIDEANKGFPYNYNDTASDYDYIIVVYGLCSNGIVGISSSRIPLVVPRGHDCITFLLGSKEAYQANFYNNPGTYWFSSGWIERSWYPKENKYAALFKEYTEKYGEDNAVYLLEMEQAWIKEYKNAAFIRWDALGNVEFYREFTKNSAKSLGWNYVEFTGDSGLLKRLLNGEFNDSEVLMVPPGKKVVQTHDANIIGIE